MKTTFICSLLMPLALTAAVFVAPSNPLVGRWQHQFPNGDVVLANFRPDGSFDAFVNGKTFANGKYTVKQDVFTVSDGECGLNYTGSYSLRFFNGPDSVRFTAVQDSCRGRRRSIDGATLGRVKPARR